MRRPAIPRALLALWLGLGWAPASRATDDLGITVRPQRGAATALPEPVAPDLLQLDQSLRMRELERDTRRRREEDRLLRSGGLLDLERYRLAERRADQIFELEDELERRRVEARVGPAPNALEADRLRELERSLDRSDFELHMLLLEVELRTLGTPRK